jgi:hypothetical protein
LITENIASPHKIAECPKFLILQHWQRRHFVWDAEPCFLSQFISRCLQTLLTDLTWISFSVEIVTKQVLAGKATAGTTEPLR